MTVPGWTGVSALTLGVGGLLLSLLFPRQPGPKVQVTTAPSSWARLGSGAQLHCRFTVEGPVALDSVRVQWYLGERKVAWYDRGRSQAQSGASLPSEKELQSGDASLSLAVVTPWDKGMYKCVVWHKEHQHQGKTRLHVLVGPTISIPRPQAVAGKETSLLCHVVGFFPMDVDVVWLRDGQVQKGFTRSSPQRKLDGTFSLTLNYTFTPNLHDTGSVFSCRVYHEVLGQSLQEDVSLDILAAPTISIPRQPAVVGMRTSLLCHIRGFLPKDVDVVWLRDGQVLKDSTRSSPQMNPDGTFDLTLTYTFTPACSDASSVFSCHVHHAALGQPLQEDVILDILAAPTISIPRQPAVVGMKTSLLCHIRGFLPKDVDVVWLRDGQVLKDSTHSSPQMNPDGTFDLTLTYTFTPACSDASSVFSCHVHHVALGQPLQEDVTLVILAAPTISTRRQQGIADAETSLLCHVGGFFPEEVDVVWLRDGQVLKGSTRSSTQTNPDGTFSLTLTYTFTPTHSDASSVFSCHVHHAALGQPLKENVSLGIRVQSTDVDQTRTQIIAIIIIAGTVVIIIISCHTNRRKGWAVSYSISEVAGPERCLLGQEVTLRCSMEGTFPEDVTIKWEWIHSDDRTVPESNQPQSPSAPRGCRVTEERAGTRLTSSLTFTPTVQDDGARVRCLFLHETKLIREERVSPEIQVWARPQVSEIQVLPEWDPRDKVPFAVQLHNFYPREVPPIQWGWDGAGSWREDPALIDKNADGTFTATSVWRVPSRSLTRPELRVRVCVQHGPGEPPSERELSLRAAGEEGPCPGVPAPLQGCGVCVVPRLP
ncbi:uncharacterized protein LOC132243270 [Alligator mississippiensis]|uniref:uncharacterized protein LOC132243270 n=1 Tax=Alligator mississippiensis TaxID=8496 RepID=UPI002877EF6A|nr:uncharacterized protein LOC132243270 [Alligator mississippiensis]